MKKIFALALAVALVLSLASVALAADPLYAIDSIEAGAHKIPSKKTFVNDATTNSFSYGNTIFYPLRGLTFADKNDLVGVAGQVVKYDAVKGIKISEDWTVGSEWVSKVELVKKRYGDGGPYIYFLSVAFKAAPTKAAAADVVGEIILKKTSGDNKIDRAKAWSDKGGETPIFDINLTLEYTDPDSDKTALIIKDSKKFSFGTDGTSDEDEEFEFSIDKWPDATFTVNTVGQGDIVLKATADFNADIAALYPEANLDFFIGNGASFNKTGTMFIPAEEGSFIYELKNGALVAISGAEYDEYDEGFYFKTRTLGQYVVSDVELDLAAAVVPSVPGDISVVEPGAPGVVVNPTTGAAL